MFLDQCLNRSNHSLATTAMRRRERPKAKEDMQGKVERGRREREMEAKEKEEARAQVKVPKLENLFENASTKRPFFIFLLDPEKMKKMYLFWESSSTLMGLILMFAHAFFYEPNTVKTCHVFPGCLQVHPSPQFPCI